MKKRAFILALAMAMSIAGAVTGKMHKRYRAIKYIDSVNPTVCLSGSTLPSECTALTMDEICSLTFNGFSRTYYTGTTCVTPYYRWQ